MNYKESKKQGKIVVGGELAGIVGKLLNFFYLHTMSKITYLFSAGASCEAMPLVADMPARMKAIGEFLAKGENHLSKTAKYELDNLHSEPVPGMRKNYQRNSTLFFPL